jgi:hypothetical protein
MKSQGGSIQLSIGRVLFAKPIRSQLTDNFPVFPHKLAIVGINIFRHKARVLFSAKPKSRATKVLLSN